MLQRLANLRNISVIIVKLLGMHIRFLNAWLCYDTSYKMLSENSQVAAHQDIKYLITVKTYLYFGGSKITADGDCSHEIKRCLLLGT